MQDKRILEPIKTEEMKKNNPWRPVVLYAVFGFIWILYSDRVLGSLVQDPSVYAQFQTYKGWFYVLLTAVLLYIFIRMDNRIVFTLNKDIQEKNHELVAFAEETLAMEQELKNQVTQLDQMVHKDPLTGLRNRLVFENDLKKYIQSGEEFSVYYLDIDQFKNLNDIHGHNFGDLFLIEFTSLLNDNFTQLQLYRWGGDEFLIIDPINKGIDVTEVAQCIIDLTNRTWHLGDVEFHTSTSVGVVHCPEHGNDLTTIFKNLEIALYKAKENGRSRCEFFDPSFLEEIERKSKLEAAIDEALNGNGFCLNYQPIYDLKFRKLHHLEALLRFIDTVELNTHIGEVIAVAEQTGQIHKIDGWVVDHVFATMKEKQGLIPDVKIAVNISAQTFSAPTFIPYLSEMINKYQIDPHLIELEITEHTIINSIHDSYEVMKKIKSLGFIIALDDFGTRYSSLNYLSRLPFDVLKVDKSYVDNILNGGKGHIIVQQIITLAGKLGLDTVAEGIELLEQEKSLKEIGCNFGQGYYYSRPQTFERIVERFGEKS